MCGIIAYFHKDSQEYCFVVQEHTCENESQIGDFRSESYITNKEKEWELEYMTQDLESEFLQKINEMKEASPLE